jgi:aminomethyltransferase
MSNDLKKTPLSQWHAENGGKMVEYAGFEMPVQYKGVLAEHAAVRETAGIFDITHMGEIIVSGTGATSWLENLITNRIAKTEPGQITYTAMCNEAGTVLDDMLIYRLADQKWMVVCNAANHEKIINWMQNHIVDDVELSDISHTTAMIAVQGPHSEEIVASLNALQQHQGTFSDLEFYTFMNVGDWIVSRTGYTGEHGYELYIPFADALPLWEELMSLGKEKGMVPVGLAARDTLRFEVGYCLYGHELSENWTPLEAGIGWAVRMKKDSFIGLDVIKGQKESGVPRRIRGFEVLPTIVGEKTRPAPIARQDCELYCGDKQVGFVTSGTKSPTTGKSLFMALVDVDFLSKDLTVDIRGKQVAVKKQKLPFIAARVKGDPVASREL